MTLEPSGHSFTPMASSPVLMARGGVGCGVGSSLGVFVCLPIFPIYFWKGENAEDVFVDLTWKCFFFSTSCFHRPFVRSNYAACHAPPPHCPPSVEQSCVGVAGRHSLTFASFPAWFKAARQTSRPFRTSSVVQFHDCICAERRVFTEMQSKGKGVIYSFSIKREMAVSAQVRVHDAAPQVTAKCRVVNVINTQHNHRELSATNTPPPYG